MDGDAALELELERCWSVGGALDMELVTLAGGGRRAAGLRC